MNNLDKARMEYVARQLREKFAVGFFRESKSNGHNWVMYDAERASCCADFTDDTKDQYNHVISAEHIAKKYGVDIESVREADAAIRLRKELG